MPDNKRFGRYPGDNNNEHDAQRPHKYGDDPKFNKAAAAREEFDFYNKMSKDKGIGGVVERGDLARKARKH
jgi:hypothetical protein